MAVGGVPPAVRAAGGSRPVRRSRRALGPAAAPAPIRTVVWPPIAPGAAPEPVEDERDWLARIKAIRYGEAPAGAPDAADAAARPVGDARVRAPKRRAR